MFFLLHASLCHLRLNDVKVDGFPGFNASEYWTEYATNLKTKNLTTKTTLASGETKFAEDGFHEETGLGLPLYVESFEKVVGVLGYKEFLKRIDAINGPVLDRKKADAAWKYFCQQKYYTWKTELKAEEKERVLEDALAQVCFVPGRREKIWNQDNTEEVEDQG